MKNLKFFREFLKFFKHNDKSDKENETNILKYEIVGLLNVKTPIVKISFPVAITKDKDSFESACMVETTDNEFIIVFQNDYFFTVISNDLISALVATCAHEVGHYLVDHFKDKKCSMTLNVNSEIQEFFLNRYNETQSERDEQAYMRSVFFSLLRGGTMIGELEADIKALHFVSLSDLNLCHSLDFNTSKNPFIVMEKVNRIKQLNKYCENNKIDRDDYSLEFISKSIVK